MTFKNSAQAVVTGGILILSSTLLCVLKRVTNMMESRRSKMKSIEAMTHLAALLRAVANNSRPQSPSR
jgi:hypothetical protein